jgi:hypothetical protein
MHEALGERDFLAGIQRDLDLAEEVKRGMETKFGAALFLAYEQIERACFAGMASTSPFNIKKQLQLRAELMVVQYTKAQLEAYVTNAETLLANMETIQGVENEY